MKNRNKSSSATPRPTRSRKLTETVLADKSHFCFICMGTAEVNYFELPEDMVSCHDCLRSAHPSCLKLNPAQTNHVFLYDWQCPDCKSCQSCKDKSQDEYILFCDQCDRGFHTFCLDPPMKAIPDGEWNCPSCINNPIQTYSPRRGRQSKPKPNILSISKRGGISSLKTDGRRHSIPTTVSVRKRPGPPPLRDNKSSKKSRHTLAVATPPLLIDESHLLSDDEAPFPTRKNPKSRNRSHVIASPIVELPFGGKLSPEEADTAKYTPSYKDRSWFDTSRSKAEKLLQDRTIRAQSSSIPTHEMNTELDLEATASSSGTNLIPRIPNIQFGEHCITTWYAAPYPEEYNVLPTIYLCEFCLKYMNSEFTLTRHQKKCPLRHPPGDEIYRDGMISIFEVDGRKNKIYCQNLCLLAKTFLDHKTLYYDVEPFLFYVMTESNDTGHYNLVGYFSKEKRSASSYNVSCILTLPIHQRKGYGSFLIDFSYLLSKKEGRAGTPEKPLSDLGLLSYRYYWRATVIQALLELNDSSSSITIQDISSMTKMMHEDIVHTLHLLNMITKNEHGQYTISYDRSALEDFVKKIQSKGYPSVNAEKLRWSPFMMLRSASDLVSPTVNGATSDDQAGRQETENVDTIESE